MKFSFRACHRHMSRTPWANDMGWCFSWDYSIDLFSQSCSFIFALLSENTKVYPKVQWETTLPAAVSTVHAGYFWIASLTHRWNECVRAGFSVIFYGSERNKRRFPFASQATWSDSLREHIIHLTFQVSQRSSFFIYKIRVISMNSQCKIQGTERNQQALKDSFHPWPCCFVNDTKKGQCILFAGYRRRKTLCRLNNHVKNIF